jgi:glycosyltransferase involved in cell wall biosynthesis
MKDVGIVMPVYKQDPVYLELALQSILQQSYQNYYFVIVSDGAPAETVNVIKNVTKGDGRVKLILKEKNEGVARTLNTGFDYLMKIGEVKYLTWVSSDNIYYPTFVEKLRNALEKAPAEVGLSYSSFRHIDHNGDFLKEPGLEEFYKYQNQPKENLIDVCFIGVSFMYKKQIASQIEGYKLEPVEDYEYWLRLTEKCEIVYVQEVLMEYRTNSPLSVSAQLRKSKAQHRRWRYAFNLARQEARNRRKIPFMLTVIYPVSENSEKTIEKLEQLLEQSYSNFKLIIIDRSNDQFLIKKLQQIEDPRVAIFKLQGASEKEAIRNGMNYATTPFTLIYGKGNFPSSPLALYDLIIQGIQIEKQRRESVALVDSGYRRVNHRIIRNMESPVLGDLYLTKTLLEIMK